MAISHVGTVAGSGNTTTSVTITLNFATQAGDLIFLATPNGGANANGTDPAGTVVTTGGVTFSIVDGTNPGGSGTIQGNLWMGVATGDHNGQTVVKGGMTNSTAGVVTVLRGADPTPVTTSAVANAAGTNQLAALDAGGNSGCWLVLALCTDDNTACGSEAATDPATVTERGEHLSGGGDDTGATLCAAAMSGTGSTGTITWTNTRTLFQIAIGAIFKEPSAPDDFPSWRHGTQVHQLLAH